MLNGKTVREMTPSEKKEYNRYLAEERAKRREDQWAKRKALEAAKDTRAREFLARYWQRLEEKHASLETAQKAALIWRSLGDEAKRVVSLCALSDRHGGILYDEVFRVSGIKSRKRFDLMMESLLAVGAILPNEEYEYEDERAFDELRKRDLLPQSDGLEWLELFIIDDAGYRMNYTLAEIALKSDSSVSEERNGTPLA